MNLDDYKAMSSQLRLEILNKGLTTTVKNNSTGQWESRNIANLLIGTINKGLYKRSQTTIVRELKDRKNSILLPSNTPLLSVFDEVHHACRIVVLRKLLAEMDLKYSTTYGLSRIPVREWDDIAFQSCTAIRDLFNKHKAKKADTLYKNLIQVVVKDPVLEKEEYQQQKKDMLEGLSIMGHISNHQFADAQDFSLCETGLIKNLRVESVPTKSTINKKPVQLSLFDILAEQDLTRR